jgi:hypothetical protein
VRAFVALWLVLAALARPSSAAPSGGASDAGSGGASDAGSGEKAVAARAADAGADVGDDALPDECMRLLRQPFESSGLAGFPGSAAGGDASAASLDTLIAGVPDPIDSGLATAFDSAIEAIEIAIQKVGYLRDRSWLPWNDTRPEADRQRSEQCRQFVPGVILFRRSKPPDASVGFQAPWLAVFLVGEVPTSGVHRRALARAVTSLAPSSCARLSFLGPAFSGSAESIRDELSASSHSCAGSSPLGGVRFLSGTVSALSVQSTLAAFPAWTFQSTRPTNDAIEHALYGYLQRNRQIEAPDSGILPGVAMLVESGTAFGQSVAGSRGPGSPSPESILEFPPLHHDATEASASGTKDKPRVFPRRDIELPLASATNDGHDTILDTFFDQIIHNRFRFVGIVSSDSQDVMYLAHRIHVANADVRVFAFDTDVTYLDESQSRDMYGAIVVSSYLFPGDGEFGAGDVDHAKHRHVPIDGQAYAGVYNAALGLVRPDLFARDAVGYIRTETGLFLPVWVAAVANGEYSPLGVGRSELGAADGGALSFVYGQSDAFVEEGATPPDALFDLHSPEPKLWYALIVVLSIGGSYLFAMFVRARTAGAKRSPAETWPGEGLFVQCDHPDHVLEQNLIAHLLFSYSAFVLAGITAVTLIRPSLCSFSAILLVVLVGVPAALSLGASVSLAVRVVREVCGSDGRAPSFVPVCLVAILCSLYAVVAFGGGIVPLTKWVFVPAALLAFAIDRASRSGASGAGATRWPAWIAARGYHVALFALQIAFLLCAVSDSVGSWRTEDVLQGPMTTLVYERWTDLAGGASPILPSLFGGCLIMVFCVGQLASLRTLDTIEHLPRGAEGCLLPAASAAPNGTGPSASTDGIGPLAFVFHTDAFARSIKEIEASVLVIARWFRRPPQLGVAAVLALGVVVLLSIEVRVEPLATFEGRGGDLLFQLTFLVGVTIIAFSLLVFVSFSRQLLLLLRALRTHPLAPAYKRVPQPWDKPLDRRLFGPPLDFSEVHMLLPVLEKALSAMKRPQGATPVDGANMLATRIFPPEDRSPAVALKGRALFVEASRGVASPSEVLSPVFAAARILYHERRRDFRPEPGEPARAPSTPLAASLEDEVPGSMRAEPSRPPPDRPEGKLWSKFDQSVDVLVASVVSVVISQLIAQYRYLVFVVVGCTMLLSLKLTSYPFAPHGFLTEFLWVGTLLVAVATFAVYAVLRRDPLLALIGQYKSGNVSYNLDLLKWFLTWVAVPTLGAAAVRYPAVFASFSQWIGPLTKQ